VFELITGEKLKKILLISVLISAAACFVYASEFSDDMLKSPGVRASGLAGAFSAVADDYSAFYWNPAGLSLLDTASANIFYHSIFKGTQSDFGFSVFYPGPQDIGLSAAYISTSYSSSIFSKGVLYLSASAIVDKAKEFYLGINFKGTSISAADYDLSAFVPSLNAGIMYIPLYLEKKMRFAFVINDLDTNAEWNNGVKETVPYFARFGSVYFFDDSAFASLDLKYISGLAGNEGFGVHFGGEKTFDNEVAGNFGFRAGFAWESLYESGITLAFGASYARKEFKVDYVFLPDMRGFGETHKIDAAWFFGDLIKKEKEEKPSVITAEKKTEEKAAAVPEDAYTQASLSISSKYVSPDKNGVNDTIKFVIKDAPYDPGNTVTTLEIFNSLNEIVRKIKYTGNVPLSMEWNGLNEEAIELNDGDYTARVTIMSGESLLWQKTRVVTVDKTPPVFDLYLEPKVFAPGPMTVIKEMSISIESKYTDIKAWQFFIKDDAGHTIKKITGEGFTSRLMWNGKDALSNYAKDGGYRAQLFLEDLAGNKYDASEKFIINTEKIKFSVNTQNVIFKPGRDSVTVNVKFPELQVLNWSAEITDGAGNVMAEFNNKPPGIKSVVWDGTNSKNQFVTGGRGYRLNVKVIQKSGVLSEQKSLLQADLPEFKATGIKLILAAVKFPANDATIPIEEYSVLNQAAEAVKQYAQGYNIFIKGFSTDSNDPDRNLKMSIDRARQVADYLSEGKGIPAENIYIVGYGDGEYADVSIKESAPAKGNRVEVELLTE
jgi:outer membrane protein OmpA-like peptidoglycan-associated protein